MPISGGKQGEQDSEKSSFLQDIHWWFLSCLILMTEGWPLKVWNREQIGAHWMDHRVNVPCFSSVCASHCHQPGGRKKILWRAYVDTQNYADGKSEKNLSSAMATRQCCNSCVKCMMSMSLSNQKKRGETGCKKDLSESSLSVEKS